MEKQEFYRMKKECVQWKQKQKMTIYIEADALPP